MISNDYIGTFLVPLPPSKFLDYIHFNLLCGNIMDYDKIKSSDDFPLKTISSKRSGLVTSSFDDQDFTKKSYLKLKNERNKIQLCEKLHDEHVKCVSNHVYLLDSISIYFLLDYIKSIESKFIIPIKEKDITEGNLNSDDKKDNKGIFELHIAGVVPVKNFVYGTEKYWLSKNGGQNQKVDTRSKQRDNISNTNPKNSMNKKYDKTNKNKGYWDSDDDDDNNVNE